MATFHWIRELSYPAGTTWSTVYESWVDPGDSWQANTQQGSLVIDDMLDDTPGAGWRRETLQSWGYGAVRQGRSDRFGPGYYGARPADAPVGLPPAVEAPMPPQAGQGWTELPQGKPIGIKANYYYAAVAMVKSNHSAADIRNVVVSKGGVQVIDLQDPYQAPWLPAADSGYRNVGMTIFASRDAGALPWEAPGILSLADGSHLIRAWAAPKEKGMPALPPTPPSSSTGTIVTVLGAVGVATAGFFTFRWLRKRRQKR